MPGNTGDKTAADFPTATERQYGKANRSTGVMDRGIPSEELLRWPG